MATQTRPSQATVQKSDKYARSETGLTLPDLLQKYPQKIALAIPKYMDPERMIRIALTAFYKTPTLWDVDPLSLAGAVIQCAQLGLEPDGVLGLAYLVPFYNSRARKKECNMLVGYKGYIHLGRRSGEVKTVGAELVYENDDFRFGEGTSPYIEHVPYIMRRSQTRIGWEVVPPEERGDKIAAYSVIQLRDGGHQQKVMGMGEIWQIRDDNSKSAYNDQDQLTGPWRDHPDWMEKKTTIRQLYKLAPLSAEIRTATSLEDRADAGLSQELGDLITDITHDRPANPRGPIPQPGPAPAGNGQPPEAAGAATGAPQGQQAPAQGNSQPQASAPQQAPQQDDPPPFAPDPDFDDKPFSGEPQQQQPAKPAPLTVGEFTSEQLQQVQFNLKRSRVAVNRAQVEAWCAQKFTRGQVQEALVEAARIGGAQ
jgi:recombination protein RecT